MRKLLPLLLMFLVAWSLLVSNADARRFGGGRSFGSTHSYSYSPARGASTGRNIVGGLIGGMILGGLISTLFMGHGVGPGLLSWLVIFGVIYYLKNLLTSRSSQRFQSLHSQYAQPQQNFQNASSSSTLNVNEADFLRAANVLFMRLQAANDAKNMADVRQFTTPEVAAEIQMQFQERGDAVNITEVLQLDSQLIGVQGSELSVRFSGLIKEDNQAPEKFSENWHFIKDATTQKWVVAGMQQA